MKCLATIVLYRLPISVNHAYPQSRTGRRYLSPEGKAFKEEIGWEAKKVYKLPPNEDNLVLGLYFSWKDKRRRDCQNYIKLIADALEGIIVLDDKQFTSGTWNRQYLGIDRILIKVWDGAQSAVDNSDIDIGL